MKQNMSPKNYASKRVEDLKTCDLNCYIYKGCNNLFVCMQEWSFFNSVSNF